MEIVGLALITCAVSIIPAADPLAELTQQVDGRVLDQHGRVVPQATIAEQWRFDATSDMTPEALFPSVPGLSTGDDGRFSGRIRKYTYALFATDESKKLGGIIRLNDPEKRGSLTFHLAPMVRVRGKLTSKKERISLLSHGALITFPEGGIVASCSLTPTGDFAAMLPPGSYALGCAGSNHRPAFRKFEVVPSGKELQLAPLELEPCPFVDIGNPPPGWKVSDAYEISKNVKLEDFRGRWVLIEFWTTRSGAMVPESIRALSEFDQKHFFLHKEQYSLLAFHDDSVRDYAGIRAALVRAKIPKNNPGEMNIPMLFDASGSTFKDWGIYGVPRDVLIDPQGNIFDCGSDRPLDVLKKKLTGRSDEQ